MEGEQMKDVIDYKVSDAGITATINVGTAQPPEGFKGQLARAIGLFYPKGREEQEAYIIILDGEGRFNVSRFEYGKYAEDQQLELF